MKFGQLHHVEYYVNDLERSNEFWNWFFPKLGYKEYQKWKMGVSWAHENGTYIVFVQVEKEYLSVQNNRQGNGLNHIAFKGSTLEHLKQLQRELEARSIQILKSDDDHLCFEDPNGFAVEIFL